eukprot:365582-Chlamydomonas_euryale.AAC.3
MHVKVLEYPRNALGLPSSAHIAGVYCQAGSRGWQCQPLLPACCAHPIRLMQGRPADEGAARSRQAD